MCVINVEICNGKYRLNNDNKTIIKRKLTSEDIFNMISSLEFSGDYRGKPDSVEMAEIPFMMETFYLYIYKFGRIPSQEEFADEYFFNNNIILNPDGSCVYIYNDTQYVKSTNDLMSRIYRAFPSFIRELYLYYKLLESGKFKYIRYSVYSDIKGTDIKVTRFDNKEFHLDSFVNSKRSSYFYEQKNNYRHNNTKDFNKTIKVIFDFDDKLEAGNYYLYSDETINKTIEEILSK